MTLHAHTDPAFMSSDKCLRVTLMRVKALMAREWQKHKRETYRFVWLQHRETDSIVALARVEPSEY